MDAHVRFSITFFPVLWPLFHYVLWGEVTNGSAENQYWEDYVKVNQAFTDAIVSVYKPGDIGMSRKCASVWGITSSNEQALTRLSTFFIYRSLDP